MTHQGRPSLREFQDALTVLQYELEDPSGSAEAYQAALTQLDPGRAALARLRLGHLWAASGRYEDAMSAYRAAADPPGPYRSEAALRLGNLLYELGMLDQAESAYRQALTGDDERAVEASLRLGNVLFEQERYADAALAYERTLAREHPHWSKVARRMLQRVPQPERRSANDLEGTVAPASSHREGFSVGRPAEEVSPLVTSDEPDRDSQEGSSVHEAIEATIWVSTDDPQKFNDIGAAVISLMERAGFDVTPAAPARRASWAQRLRVKARDAMSHEEVARRLADVEDAIRAQQLELPQSQATLALSQAASATIEALRGITEAVLVVGNLLMVKTSDSGTERIVTYTMTAEELRQFKHQDLPRNPAAALHWLDERSKERAPSAQGAPEFLESQEPDA